MSVKTHADRNMFPTCKDRGMWQRVLFFKKKYSVITQYSIKWKCNQKLTSVGGFTFQPKQLLKQKQLLSEKDRRRTVNVSCSRDSH